MARIQIHRDGLAFDDPTLVEGLPGVGLVGKITADHLIEHLDMVHYGSLHCEGLPRIAVYQADEDGVAAPVRIYADEANDLLVLSSDVPVSPSGATEFADCVSEWIRANDVTSIFLSGIPAEKNGVPAMWGVATGDAGHILSEHDIDRPGQNGAVTGPTGALLYEAERRDLPSIALVVEADAQFPDPEAARVVLTSAIEPITGVDVDTDQLVEQAEEISEARAELAQRMQAESDETTSAKPIGMYQ